MIQKANDDRDQIHEEARIAGVEQAKEEAKEAAIEKIALGLETLDSIAKELRELKETYLRAGAEGMIDIINAILHKVIMTEVTFDRDLILRSIERAIEQISAADKINMRINPEDLSAVDEFKQGIHNLIEGVSEINLRTDDGIIRGGLIIETDFGRVDARLEAQISEIIRDVRLTVQGLPIDSLIEQSVEEIEEDLEPSIEPTIEPETASELLISESRQLDEQVADPEIAETPGTPETMETPELVDSTFEREPQLENDSPSHPEDENTVSSTEPEEEN
ncbi:MAG: hypothetical protein JKX97_07025 [Candidatus Lindowbacteria bacterium]|nr:hypothetical protein [Candidatus Lindowbacteria bacterium]